MKNFFVVATRLPRAGLGNMLLVWARAVIFSELNSLPMLAPNWKTFYPGAWLRGERVKRYYGSYFSDINYRSRLAYNINSLLSPKYIHSNPNISTLDLTSSEFESSGQHTFLFDRMPPWNDYFKDLKNYQPLIKKKLYDDIHQPLLDKILARPSPQIGIHIRRGDYQQPQTGEDFAEVPIPRSLRVVDRERRQSIGGKHVGIARRCALSRWDEDAANHLATGDRITGKRYVILSLDLQRPTSNGQRANEEKFFHRKQRAVIPPQIRLHLRRVARMPIAEMPRRAKVDGSGKARTPLICTSPICMLSVAVELRTVGKITR